MERILFWQSKNKTIMGIKSLFNF